MGGIEATLLAFISFLFDKLGWGAIVVGMAIESACIPLPSEIIMPLGGWQIVQKNGLGLGGVTAAAFFGALGCTIGSIIAYWVGALGGRPIIERYGKYLLINTHHLATADRWFAKYGEITAFVSRLLPVIRTFISFPAGVARMNFVKFIIYTFIGSFIWSWPLAYAGYVLGDKYEQIRSVMRPFDYPIAAVVVLVVLYFFYRQWRARQSETKLQA